MSEDDLRRSPTRGLAYGLLYSLILWSVAAVIVLALVLLL